MFLIAKSCVFLYLFLTTPVLMFKANRTLTDKEIDQIFPSDFNESYVYLVMGGYRPQVHTLAKHIVSIRRGNPKKFIGDNHFCGGSIISENVVLTAAHCVVNEKGMKLFSKFTVVAGTPLLFEPTITMRTYKIKTEIINPTYSYATMRGDFALLISEENFDEDGQSIQRIPLIDVAPYDGMRCTSLGWGRTFLHGPRPDELLYVNLTLLKRLKCNEYFQMNPSVICAANRDDHEKGVWKGDSGGPLICDGKLTGVVSFGFPKKSPSYFANVYEHRHWILGNSAEKLSLPFEMLFFVLFILCIRLIIEG